MKHYQSSQLRVRHFCAQQLVDGVQIIENLLLTEQLVDHVLGEIAEEKKKLAMLAHLPKSAQAIAMRVRTRLMAKKTGLS